MSQSRNFFFSSCLLPLCLFVLGCEDDDPNVQATGSDDDAIPSYSLASDATPTDGVPFSGPGESSSTVSTTINVPSDSVNLTVQSTSTSTVIVE